MVATTCLPSGLPKKFDSGDRNVAKLASVYARVHFSTPRPVGEFSQVPHATTCVLVLSYSVLHGDKDIRLPVLLVSSSSESPGPSRRPAFPRRRVNVRRARSPVEGMMKVPLRIFCIVENSRSMSAPSHWTRVKRPRLKKYRTLHFSSTHAAAAIGLWRLVSWHWASSR